MAGSNFAEQAIHNGGCLCGAVRYQVRGALRDVVNCHCAMCRRLHGAFGAHSKAKKTQIDIVTDDGLAWYATSEQAQRGFCRRCGTNLFWQPVDQDATGIVAGSLDAPTGLKTLGHIFTAEKSDFYEIADELPCFDGSSDGGFDGDRL
jgi:hypothetical protein|tara:strand:+ start:124 stop:567 length:444 start_codon:yes stop_codon:yes gene_type:complete